MVGIAASKYVAEGNQNNDARENNAQMRISLVFILEYTVLLFASSSLRT
jgi:hypothetical protein